MRRSYVTIAPAPSVSLLVSSREPKGQDVALRDSDSESDDATSAEIIQVLERLPPEQREEVLQIFEKVHMGPICAPEDLARYEAILPGLAERIVRLPEREQEHRHRLIEAAVERDYTLKSRGQILAMVALIILAGLALAFALLGDIKSAAIVGVGTIAAVVGIFVTGRIVDAQDNRAPKE